jgi:hypothetical protein
MAFDGFDMGFPHVLEDSHPKSCQSRENSKSLAGRTVGPLGNKKWWGFGLVFFKQWLNPSN